MRTGIILWDYPDYRTVVSLIPNSLAAIVFSWVPGHTKIPVNEVADQLAHDTPSVPFLPLPPSIPRFMKPRFKSYELSKALHPIALAFEFDHLKYLWYPGKCSSLGWNLIRSSAPQSPSSKFECFSDWFLFVSLLSSPSVFGNGGSLLYCLHLTK